MDPIGLARRLEAHEAWSAAAHASTQARLHPQMGAEVLSIAGAHAVYNGRSPLTRVYGLGMTAPVTKDDLDRIEAFFAVHGFPSRIRVCPHADSSLLTQLAARGYTLASFMNVYVEGIGVMPEIDPAVDVARDTDLQIAEATREEARWWFERQGAGGDWAEPDGIAFMLVRCVLKPGARLFLAWADDGPVAGGALEMHDGVAALYAAETLPAYRRRGIHTALMRTRLAAAAEAGCDIAMVHTLPGAASARNVLRAGFGLQYTVARMARPRSGDAVKRHKGYKHRL